MNNHIRIKSCTNVGCFCGKMHINEYDSTVKMNLIKKLTAYFCYAKENAKHTPTSCTDVWLWTVKCEGKNGIWQDNNK